MDELDWKTYDTAEKKAKSYGRHAQAQKFQQGKINAFNKKYAINGYEKDDWGRRIYEKPTGESYSMRLTGSIFNQDNDAYPVLNLKDRTSRTLHPHPRGSHKYNYETRTKDGVYGTTKPAYFDVDFDEMDDDDIEDKASDGDWDYLEYQLGNSKYSNGRWRHFDNYGVEDFTWGSN